jgi:predicted Fe-Mo cluster-binding NifX family protein
MWNKNGSRVIRMKIILTAASPNFDADIDPRFGRCAYLLVVDTESMNWEAHSNPGLTASGGAGIKAAQFAADQHAEVALSGDFGPHAYNALQAGGIAMYRYGNCTTVAQAIERFRNNQLEQVGIPTRGEWNDGHHGQSK